MQNGYMHGLYLTGTWTFDPDSTVDQRFVVRYSDGETLSCEPPEDFPTKEDRKEFLPNVATDLRWEWWQKGEFVHTKPMDAETDYAAPKCWRTVDNGVVF